MNRKSVLRTLVKFEGEIINNPSIQEKRTKIEEINIIKNDIERTKFELRNEKINIIMKKFYFLILFNTFMSFSLEYIQGMLDFSSIILDVYFRSAVLTFINESENEQFKNNLDIKQSYDKITFENISEDDKIFYDKFEKENIEIFKKFKNSIINILDQYFLFFAKDNFKMYLNFGSYFIYLMKSEYKKDFKNYLKSNNLNVKDSVFLLSFMQFTLTFFKPLYGNRETAYKAINIILSSRPHIVFCFLAVYFTKITSKTYKNNKDTFILESINDNDLHKIIELYGDFFEYKKSKDKLFYYYLMIIFLIFSIGFKYYKVYYNR